MSEQQAKSARSDNIKNVTLPSPEQRSFNNTTVPLVYKCEDEDFSVQETVNWIKDNQTKIDSALLKHGAILFRGFPLKKAEDFNEFVKALPYEDLPYEKSLSFAVRLHVVGRVCTTNEGKTGGQVFHHEQAQTPLYPSKLLFYCEKTATTGGGTAVCPSDVVLQQLEAKYPDFVKDCETKGVKYTAIMGPDQDSSKGAGRSWKSFFGRDTKESVEERMKELEYTWKWTEGEVLHATSPILSAVREAPGTNRRVFFNQLVAQIANAKEFATKSGDSSENALGKFMTFGDDTPLNVEILEYAKQLCEENAVELEWQEGDVALLDNFLVMHARRAFEGPRRVLASICL